MTNKRDSPTPRAQNAPAGTTSRNRASADSLRELQPSEAEIQKALYGNTTRRNKYGVAPPEQRTWDGILFASKREMEAYLKFSALLRNSKIADMKRQVRYELYAVNPKGENVIVGEYRADFVITERDGDLSVYDSKGMSTPLYKWKKKHVEAQYGLRIIEI